MRRVLLDPFFCLREGRVLYCSTSYRSGIHEVTDDSTLPLRHSCCAFAHTSARTAMLPYRPAFAGHLQPTPVGRIVVTAWAGPWCGDSGWLGEVHRAVSAWLIKSEELVEGTCPTRETVWC